MWMGAIRLVVETGDTPNAGTDRLVQATVIRDGAAVRSTDGSEGVTAWNLQLS
jgi:hypothetical protein